MRRFSSEGNLLDLDFLPWKKVALKDANYENDGDSGTYTPQPGDEDMETCTSLPLIILEPGISPSKAELSREHSISAENLTELNKLEKHLLGVGKFSDGCRAYSDGQLVPPTKGSTDSVASDDPATPTSPSTSPSTLKYRQRHQTRAKLSAAKLHLKSLFGQSPHSSTSNLTNTDQRENTEQKDSAKERRSRLKFMRQWSQVGHGKSKFSREELHSWATSLNSLLGSRTGVSVFGAFLRSEFSEENLQFYLACDQYEHSSHNFSLQRRARDICATYIEPGSPREVNLDSKTRDLTIQLLQAPSHNSLSHAKKRIYSLLDTDCYPRFLQSNVYLSLLSDAD